MTYEVAKFEDNPAEAARFIRAIIAWFPDGDPPEEWTKQAVNVAKRHHVQVMKIAFEALKRQGLRKLPTIPQIDVALSDAETVYRDKLLLNTMPRRDNAQILRELAFKLLVESFHTFQDEIAELTNYGYGAWTLTELSREAWRCAQSGNPMQFPLWRKILTKSGPHVNPWPVYWGQWIPDHHLAKFFIPELTAPVPELDYGQNTGKSA